jgi:hypothetical protein
MLRTNEACHAQHQPVQHDTDDNVERQRCRQYHFIVVLREDRSSVGLYARVTGVQTRVNASAPPSVSWTSAKRLFELR